MSHPSPDQLERLTEINEALEVQETSDLLTELGALKFEPFHEPEEAITALRRAIDLNLNSVDARFWLAKVYFHDYCDYTEAGRLLDEAIDLNSDRADCLCLRASVLRDSGGSSQERLELLERAIKVAPDWIMTHRLLADLHRDKRNFRRAKEELEKALHLAEEHRQRFVTEPGNEYYERAVTGRLIGQEDIASLLRALESINHHLN